MKKRWKVVAVSLLIMGLSTSMVLAETSGRGNRDGQKIGHQMGSVEERLEFKIQRIEELIELDQLTAEEGAELEAVMIERMENCSGDAAGRPHHGPLGIGFGRTSERGHGQGRGHHFRR